MILILVIMRRDKMARLTTPCLEGLKLRPRLPAVLDPGPEVQVINTTFKFIVITEQI